MTEHSQRAQTPRVPLIFYVTDRRGLGLEDPRAAVRLLEIVEHAARAGVDAIQLREKDIAGRALLELTAGAIERAGQTKIIVNDRLDIALGAGASGVHLGGESIGVAEAFAFRVSGRAPATFMIGRSCHSLEEASRAEEDGADYIFFGPVFATPSKARFGPPQGSGALAAVCRGVRIPVVAIGGVTLENAGACIAAGAAGLAAIRLFQESGDLAPIVRGLRKSN